MLGDSSNNFFGNRGYSVNNRGTLANFDNLRQRNANVGTQRNNFVTNFLKAKSSGSSSYFPRSSQFGSEHGASNRLNSSATIYSSPKPPVAIAPFYSPSALFTSSHVSQNQPTASPFSLNATSRQISNTSSRLLSKSTDGGSVLRALRELREMRQRRYRRGQNPTGAIEASPSASREDSSLPSDSIRQEEDNEVVRKRRRLDIEDSMDTNKSRDGDSYYFLDQRNDSKRKVASRANNEKERSKYSENDHSRVILAANRSLLAARDFDRSMDVSDRSFGSELRMNSTAYASSLSKTSYESSRRKERDLLGVRRYEQPSSSLERMLQRTQVQKLLDRLMSAAPSGPAPSCEPPRAHISTLPFSSLASVPVSNAQSCSGISTSSASSFNAGTSAVNAFSAAAVPSTFSSNSAFAFAPTQSQTAPAETQSAIVPTITAVQFGFVKEPQTTSASAVAQLPVNPPQQPAGFNFGMSNSSGNAASLPFISSTNNAAASVPGVSEQSASSSAVAASSTVALGSKPALEGQPVTNGANSGVPISSAAPFAFACMTKPTDVQPSNAPTLAHTSASAATVGVTAANASPFAFGTSATPSSGSNAAPGKFVFGSANSSTPASAATTFAPAGVVSTANAAASSAPAVFSFGNAVKAPSVQPAVNLSTSVTSAATIASGNSNSTPAFCFSKPASSTVTTTNATTVAPAFAFGTKPSNTGSSLFGAPQTSTSATPAPTPVANAGFPSFGGKPQAAASTAAPLTFAFSANPTTSSSNSLFGAPQTAPSAPASLPVFASKPQSATSITTTASVPAFAFGAKPANNNVGGSLFGASQTAASAAPSAPASLPVFGGGKPQSSSATCTTASAPAFAFGAKPANNASGSTAKPVFGGKPQSDTKTSNAASTSTFAFGAKPANNTGGSAFSSPQTSSAAVPVFGGKPQSATMTSAPSAPNFAFGAKATNNSGASLFGTPQNNAKGPSAAVPPFGQKPAHAPSSSNAFVFGGNTSGKSNQQTQSKNSPAPTNSQTFAFGASNTASPAAQSGNKSNFAFGSQNTTNKPAQPFNFATAPPAAANGGFQFAGQNNNSAFQFANAPAAKNNPTPTQAQSSPAASANGNSFITVSGSGANAPQRRTVAAARRRNK